MIQATLGTRQRTKTMKTKTKYKLTTWTPTPQKTAAVVKPEACEW